MGLMATEVLIERIEGKRGPEPVQLVLEPELVIRGSTKELLNNNIYKLTIL
jgi:DNA-binding LacI/PurR family transcriptional regulator